MKNNLFTLAIAFCLIQFPLSAISETSPELTREEIIKGYILGDITTSNERDGELFIFGQTVICDQVLAVKLFKSVIADSIINPILTISAKDGQRHTIPKMEKHEELVMTDVGNARSKCIVVKKLKRDEGSFYQQEVVALKLKLEDKIREIQDLQSKIKQFNIIKESN